VFLGKYAELQPSIQELSEKEKRINLLEDEMNSNQLELDALKQNKVSLQVS